MTSENSSIDRGPRKNERRVHSIEKDAYLKPLLKLKQQEGIVERELATAIHQMKIDSNIVQDIERYVDEVTRARENFLDNLCKRLEEIRSELRAVKCAAELPGEVEVLDLNAYKKRLIELSQQIQDFNKYCSIELLAEESGVLETEFRLNLGKHKHKSKNAIVPSVARRKDEEKKAVDYSEAQDFHALVARTGHSEDWSDEDHLLFLNLRKKYNNIPALVAAIQEKCPDLAIETIVNHEAWYRKYLTLREKQRSAVLRWRKEKKEGKTPNTQDKKNMNAEEPDVRDENTECNSRKRAEKKSETSSTETKSSSESDRSQVKELIKLWRIERENQRAEEEEQLKLRMQSRRLFQENRKQRRLQKIRNALNDYKRRKALEAETKNASKNSREKCRVDLTLIKAFREQDKVYAQRKRDLIQRSQKPKKTEINLSVKKPLTTRSTTTLYNPTEIWNAKCRIDTPVDKGTNQLQYIKDVPKFCTKWRNEESVDLRADMT